MEPIKPGAQGSAVADIQERLSKLGYTLDEQEITRAHYGTTTARAVQTFQKDHRLESSGVVDTVCWEALVDEGYNLGDRTLYLRLPNFHGNDVRVLQRALNILGFRAGETDGVFGTHTESAVKQFQQNIGLLSDGICFQDTLQAVLRLHHVWDAQNADAAPATGAPLGFARAAEVLETKTIAICATDAITRSIAARVWNLASATTEVSQLVLVNSHEEAPKNADAIIELTAEKRRPPQGVALVLMNTDGSELSLRLSMALELSKLKPPQIQLRLPPALNDYSGSFTAAKAQALAGIILDTLCATFA